MAFRIVYGRAGTGKSKFIFEDINKKIEAGEKSKIYVITPEQFSYTAEKKLMEGRKSIINAEVISFNRMAYRIKNESQVIHKELTKCGKSMLIYSILQHEKNNLKFLNKSDENIDLVMRTISEFKKNQISVENLKSKINNFEDEYLKIKLNDIILMYEKFDENLENKYVDDTDLLNILAENIDKVDLFKNSNIYIDEFVGFTKQELEIIKKLFKISKNVTITFCVDDLDLSSNPDTDIFYPNKVTLDKVLKLLDKNEKIELINLEQLRRFKNEELVYIENYLYNSKIKKYEKDVQNTSLFLAQNPYSEVEYVAKNIIKLVKEENYKYRDIAVITKNINSYSALFKAIFSKYEIPIFIDEKKDLNQNLVVRYVLSILEIIVKNYSYESVFNYLKINFLGLDEEDIFKLEKYCIKYGIKNNKFKKDFTYGIVNKKNNESHENSDKINNEIKSNENNCKVNNESKCNENNDKINYLNELRKKIISPLIDLENKISKKQNIESIVKELYLFLINEKIEEKLNIKINLLESEKRYELAEEYKLGYEIIINILDEMVNIFEGEKVTLENFYKIFTIGLKNSSLGKIPAMQDGVTVGDTERSRTHKVKAIFIIGLNDGIFPSINKDEGFLNDENREILKEKGFEIAKGTIENLYDDNFNIYKAFTTAEEKLFLSYPRLRH